MDLWASSLRDVKSRMRPLFTQERVAASAHAFLDGLLGPQRRKTGWMQAEAAGDAGPWRQQAILGRGRWEADALRDIVRDYALETLADPDAVLVFDETGFLKQGKASCGVARQYTGSAGKVPRLYDWGYLELADLEASDDNSEQSGLWTRGLLIRRNLADGECAYFTTWCPAGTGIETLVAVEGQRWTIEDGFEASKNELGLDHNETRSWHGWHRHVSLVMLAFAMLATIRHHANRQTPQKTSLATIQKQNQPSLTGRCRKSVALPRSLRSGVSSLPCHCLVALAAGPSGHRKAFSPETQNATGVVVSFGEAFR